MSKRGRFYLGRVVKLGRLNQTNLIEAINKATVLTIGKYTWTITDVEQDDACEFPFIFGKLAKFSREGHVTVVDSMSKSQVDAIAPNLLVASSPFVYIPKFSGIAYLHVWNGIQQDLFVKRFKAIIEATHGNFFVDCTIEPISDYRSFVAKLSSLERFIHLQAKVHPPNPLFGRCWKSLNEYLKHRNADEVNISEFKEDGTGIKTEIVDLVRSLIDDPHYEPLAVPDITDAALLMAADGYGRGKVVGYENDSIVTIRTADTQRSFLFPKDPLPTDLAKEASKHLEKIAKQRNMTHDA